MTRRILLVSLSVLGLAATAACGGGDDSPTAPSLPPTGTAPYSQTDLRVGTGTEAQSGQNITVNYTGWLYSNTAAENKGNVFDSGRLTSYPLNNLIACWRQGVPGMRGGGVRRLVCPPELAYGSGTPDPRVMPPNATLLFEVELISIP